MISQFRAKLYPLASIIELASGAGLVVAPALVMQLLFGSSIGSAGDHVAQLYGIALLGLGVTCWGKNCNDQTKNGLMLYNLLKLHPDVLLTQRRCRRGRSHLAACICPEPDAKA